MRRYEASPSLLVAVKLALLAGLALCSCEAVSHRLSRTDMLGKDAVENPLKAVGGDALVFSPSGNDDAWDRRRLASATPQELTAYYAPVFVQQRASTTLRPYPYPPEFDQVGEARLRREPGGKLKAFVAGPPRVYAIFETRKIARHDHVQLTYTAWYPGHPRARPIDLAAASIDSCVVRVTLGADRTPLFFETIGACGCFHKVFVERWLEDSAMKAFKLPMHDKKFAVDRILGPDSIDWEVAGVVDEPRGAPRRPVVFVKAGDHKVIGMGSEARLNLPPGADIRKYTLAEYADLYALAVDGSTEHAPFFDLGEAGEPRAARGKQRFVLTSATVDESGQPQDKSQVKLHFDQRSWSDPTIYEHCLRLPPGTL